MDGQLQASHLILDVDPVYSTWQAFSQALLVDSPLLLYIDIQHANFLPPSLATSEAQDLGPRYITAEDRAPVQDESAKCVSLSCKVHVPIEALDTPTQVAEPVEAETDQDTDMVTRRKMIVDRFIPDS